MKDVNLKRPAIIADLTRYPVENPITVTDGEAERLKASGVLEDETDDLDDKKIAELRDIASAEQINLGNAQSKPDVIAAIRAARADKGKEA